MAHRHALQQVLPRPPPCFLPTIAQIIFPLFALGLPCAYAARYALYASSALPFMPKISAVLATFFALSTRRDVHFAGYATLVATEFEVCRDDLSTRSIIELDGENERQAMRGLFHPSSEDWQTQAVIICTVAREDPAWSPGHVVASTCFLQVVSGALQPSLLFTPSHTHTGRLPGWASNWGRWGGVGGALGASGRLARRAPRLRQVGWWALAQQRRC